MERKSSTPRKIMVVADPTRESGGALQWVLSHAVLEHDELILLHVEQASSWRSTISTFLRRSPSATSPKGAKEGSTTSGASQESGGSLRGERGDRGGGGGGDLEFLEAMKNVCEKVQPKVKVTIERVEMEGKEKAFTILMQSKVFRVDLLVVGQRRHLSNAILGCRLSTHSTKATKGMDTAEYLIENSKCTCVGVQKKGQNGGYLLNTKTHKNFWLLA
ncbi:UspA [Macleaya cordata]|uniref:UspA n=1 Tax=Macleaya cordata TaxID=56857 RepID=A0A200PVT8_MACCD|nr:UspA [Macleaya cordata]